MSVRRHVIRVSYTIAPFLRLIHWLSDPIGCNNIEGIEFQINSEQEIGTVSTEADEITRERLNYRKPV